MHVHTILLVIITIKLNTDAVLRGFFSIHSTDGAGNLTRLQVTCKFNKIAVLADSAQLTSRPVETCKAISLPL